MSSFEYLAALISMVAALGIARGLSGFARMIHAKDSIDFSLVQILWTINSLLWLMVFWWFTFILSEVQVWTFPILLYTTIYASFIYLLIALLHPDPLLEGTSLTDHFLKYRKWFFGTFLVVAVLDIGDTTIKVFVTDFGAPPLFPYSLFLTTWITVGTIGYISTNMKVHTAIALIFFGVVSFWAFNMLGGIF